MNTGDGDGGRRSADTPKQVAAQSREHAEKQRSPCSGSMSDTAARSVRPNPQDEEVARGIAGQLEIEETATNVAVLAYFVTYGYVPVSTQSVAEAITILTSAPWIGDHPGVEAAVGTLLKRGLLAFEKEPELALKKDGRRIGQTVLRLVGRTDQDDLNAQVGRLWDQALVQIARRKKLVTPIGWAHRPIAQQEHLKRTIIKAPTNAVIKLMMYHGRTWFTQTDGLPAFLISQARARTDLRFEILIVGADAVAEVREGATADEHRAASTLGVAPINPKRVESGVRARIDVRTYGRSVDEALLRCVIVEQDHTIRACFITTWRFGLDRGLYGQEFELAPESTLARLCAGYFDSVFKRQRPEIRGYQQFRWLLQRHWFGLTVFVTLLLCALLSMTGVIRGDTAIGVSATAVVGWLAPFVGIKNQG